MERADLLIISHQNELSYYTDKKIIPNQELVQETIDWFENGAGSRAFRPLVMLNLLWKQYNYAVENIEDTDGIIDHLRNLPLADLEKHILFGLLIKWFGGYPLEAPLGIDRSQMFYDFKKRLLHLFLNYSEDTPEKEFCKANREQRNKLEKLSIALNVSLNKNIPLSEILTGMKENTTQQSLFKTFEDLFSEACERSIFAKPKSENILLNTRNLYNFKFNVWLQEYKNWQYGNSDQYEQLLTINNFIDFMEIEIEKQRNIAFLNGISGYDSFRLFTDRYNSLRETFRIKRKATKEDCAQIPRLKEGDIISFDPEYKSVREAYVLLTEYYSKVYLEYEKSNFTDTYKTLNSETLTAEIRELEKFITAAKNISLSEACNAYGKWGEDKDEFVYKRLASGYYENLEIEKYPFISSIGNPEACIYGKYFLFYDYLKQTLGEMTNSNETWIESLEKHIKLEQEDLANGFYKLEEYINKHVYEDPRADLQRLKQLQRNLLPWKELLQNNFIEPEKKSRKDSLLFNDWKNNAERMQRKIIAALDIIELKISHKTEIDSNVMGMSPSINEIEMTQKILRKGKKD